MAIKLFWVLFFSIIISACSYQASSESSAEKTLNNYLKAVFTKSPSEEVIYMHENLLGRIKNKIRRIALNTVKTGQEEIFQEFAQVKNIKDFDKLSPAQFYIRFRSRYYKTHIPVMNGKLVFLEKKKVKENIYKFTTIFKYSKTGKLSNKRIFSLRKVNQQWKIYNIEKVVSIDSMPEK